ncbi:26S proteasome non-ATPase regulatory subunit 9 [Coelomomyces lativittatus]|nr:26S proteasome non-ATPase regulatory subunit 9 [Coelomomyces lativittatus]KAJ1511074.1 26S proteasome non-ATPase regulatory subunit 9 [Coelomomyces lativittatus]KAJ1514181.1 26S proteasome non-ATPase regulatory subunit 9 [Coelomomyces lativittatus]
MVTDIFSSEIDKEQLLQKTKKLIAEKDELESQLNQLFDVLRSQNVGMDDSLIDEEGFPRNDIDVISVRNTRVSIIRLQNDLKLKFTEVEKALIDLHQATSSFPQKSSFASDSSRRIPPEAASEVVQSLPFALVNSVSPASPAFSAGLLQGDKIVTFGNLNFQNNNNLQALSSFVTSHENFEFNVDILRNGRLNRLLLTPRKWEGRGLLGCHILPISQPST